MHALLIVFYRSSSNLLAGFLSSLTHHLGHVLFGALEDAYQSGVEGEGEMDAGHGLEHEEF